MRKKTYRFSSKKVDYYFDASLSDLKNLVDRSSSVIITDDQVFAAHQSKLKGYSVICIPAGEDYKVQSTVDSIITQLIELGADRQTTLIGLGGGVVTDLTGYVASIYMRGIPFGFVPSTILAMVDASIGGKNGIDIGSYKNMAGIIRQPDFLLYDISLLKTLPETEWINGFAEIIKHACIKDARMFKTLQQHSIAYYRKNKKELSALIRRNAFIKSEVVVQDEFEQGDRRLLNFGHTIGHAIETTCHLPHGHAISIGMVLASTFSSQLLDFNKNNQIEQLLQQYGLPVSMQFDAEKVFALLKMDKKKSGDEMRFILLEKIGKAIVYPLPVAQIRTMLN